MVSMDPKWIALQFNENINQQNIQGLSSLMTDDHRFIDRAGLVVSGKSNMMDAWVRFFELFPENRNTFTRVESNGNLVVLYGYATWKKGEAPDHAIWTTTIEDNLVAEWRIYEDTDENKEKFNLLE
jgi:predicted SnoaL-like aldol condensation-catalyzing enzyme